MIPEIADTLPDMSVSAKAHGKVNGTDRMTLIPEIAQPDNVPSWWDGSQVAQTLDAVLAKGQTMPEKNRFPAILEPVSFHPQQDPICNEGISHGVGSGSITGQASVAVLTQESVSIALRGRDGGATAEVGDEVGFALRASQGGGDKLHVLTEEAPRRWRVRRITPLEAERLQGFKDGHTAIPWRKKGPEECPDGPRYKAIGNSMAVPCMRWIGERINLVRTLNG